MVTWRTTENSITITKRLKTFARWFVHYWAEPISNRQPVALSRAKVTHKHPPVITVLGRSLQFSPRVATSPHVCLWVTAPQVSWSAPLPFPPRVPGESLPCDVRWGLPKGVADPLPASLKDVNFYRLLSSFSSFRSWLLIRLATKHILRILLRQVLM